MHPLRNITTDLEQTVIRNGFCIGCGTCAAITSSPFSIAFNDIGQYEARTSAQSDRADPLVRDTATKVCPFSNSAADEDEIADDLFSELGYRHSDGLGYFQSIYAGYVVQDGFREKGSSGGFGSWILNELLETKSVDHVIHVRPFKSSDRGHPLFTYQVSNSPQEIALGGKSRYYPVELSEALKQVREKPGRYAIVGLPCFIKGVRLLQRQDPLIKERIRFCIGLVCGHLKSSGYAESLAWQAGIPPNELRHIDFRVKGNEGRANRYYTLATSEREERIIPTKELKGTDWGAGTFKYKACDFCDDVFAETADLVLGDAWLPQFIHDPQGTNVLVVRNQLVNSMLCSAASKGRIKINPLSDAEALKSQDAGLRHRRESLGYRLHIEQTAGRWSPSKRVQASPNMIPRHERHRQQMRIRMREISHSSFQEAKRVGDVSVYLDTFSALYDEYKKIKPGILVKLRLQVKKLMLKLAGRA